MVVSDASLKSQLKYVSNKYKPLNDLSKKIMIGSAIVALTYVSIFCLGALPLEPIYLFTAIGFSASCFGVGASIHFYVKSKFIDVQLQRTQYNLVSYKDGPGQNDTHIYRFRPLSPAAEKRLADEILASAFEIADDSAS